MNLLLHFINTLDEVENNGLTYIKELIESLGGWPILGANDGGYWNETRFSVEGLLIDVARLGRIPLFDVGITKNFKGPDSSYVIIVRKTINSINRYFIIITLGKFI